MRTECVAVGGSDMRLDVEVRFLQIIEHEGTQETLERTIHSSAAGLRLHQMTFEFSPIKGKLEIAVEQCAESAFRFRVEIFNHSEPAGPELLQSMISTHTILAANDGEFVSSIDPPEYLREAVAACHNTGTWPVLVGEPDARECMLSSPIILYDYPQLAPESQGDYFDATEVEELLALRILTLTDSEKRELRRGDSRAKEILDRIESLPAEHLMKLHGALRNVQPSGK
jgi:hydrogenase maturation protease